MPELNIDLLKNSTFSGKMDELNTHLLGMTEILRGMGISDVNNNSFINTSDKLHQIIQNGYMPVLCGDYSNPPEFTEYHSKYGNLTYTVYDCDHGIPRDSNGNILYFFEPGTQTFTGDGFTKNFFIERRPRELTSVIVDDIELSTGYTYTPLTGILQLTVSPGESKSIVVKYNNPLRHCAVIGLKDCLPSTFTWGTIDNKWDASELREWMNTNTSVAGYRDGETGFLDGFSADTLKYIAFTQTLQSSGSTPDTFDRFFLPNDANVFAGGTYTSGAWAAEGNNKAYDFYKLRTALEPSGTPSYEADANRIKLRNGQPCRYFLTTYYTYAYNHTTVWENGKVNYGGSSISISPVFLMI